MATILVLVLLQVVGTVKTKDNHFSTGHTTSSQDSKSVTIASLKIKQGRVFGCSRDKGISEPDRATICIIGIWVINLEI